MSKGAGMADITAAIVEAVRSGDGKLTCPRAFLLARRLGISPAQVGAAADAAGVRISRCQLGLFGYGSKADGTSKIVRAMDPVSPGLAARLRAATAPNGGLTCMAVWDVARKARCRRLDMAGAAQGLGLRIIDCQLGCFKPRPQVR